MAGLKRFLTLRTLIGVLFVLVFLAAIGGGYYYYRSYQKLLKNPDIITKQEVDWLKEKVGKLMVLPTDEEPSTATVLDKEKLKDQAFFKNAENGDKILIYAGTKKAILYRPSTDKIIEVMPLVIDENQTAQTTKVPEATTQNIRVALLNGTATAGLTNTAGTTLKDKIKNIDIVSKENASKTDYTKNIVVDINGNKADETKAIADALGGSVGSLPDGETAPDADILVIVAK